MLLILLFRFIEMVNIIAFFLWHLGKIWPRFHSSGSRQGGVQPEVTSSSATRMCLAVSAFVVNDELMLQQHFLFLYPAPIHYLYSAFSQLYLNLLYEAKDTWHWQSCFEIPCSRTSAPRNLFSPLRTTETTTWDLMCCCLDKCMKRISLDEFSRRELFMNGLRRMEVGE